MIYECLEARQMNAELGPLHQALASCYHRKQPPTIKEGLKEGMLSESLTSGAFIPLEEEAGRISKALLRTSSPLTDLVRCAVLRSASRRGRCEAGT